MRSLKNKKFNKIFSPVSYHHVSLVVGLDVGLSVYEISLPYYCYGEKKNKKIQKKSLPMVIPTAMAATRMTPTNTHNPITTRLVIICCYVILIKVT